MRRVSRYLPDYLLNNNNLTEAKEKWDGSFSQAKKYSRGVRALPLFESFNAFRRP